MTDPVPRPPLTDEQKRRAGLTVARSVVATHPESHARQVVELRLLLDMLGLGPVASS